MIRSAPRAASSPAISRPMFLAPPVTSASLPDSSPINGRPARAATGRRGRHRRLRPGQDRVHGVDEGAEFGEPLQPEVVRRALDAQKAHIPAKRTVDLFLRWFLP